MKSKKGIRSVLSLALAFSMMMNLAPVAYAAEKYEVAVEANEENGTISVDVIEASEGDVVTVTATPNEGYVLTQVAYREVAEDGKAGKTTAISADENGAYTFTMPAAAVEVGAAFQPEDGAVLYNSSNSNGGTIGGSKDTDYSVYISNWDVYLNVGDQSANVYLTFDKRFLEIENISMNLEIRQYNDDGYKFVGSKSYDSAELQSLVARQATEDEKAYTIQSIEIPVAEGKTYEEGLYQYCVVQFGCPEWVDAFGNEIYRWTYTGVDATVLGPDVQAPTPIVWLYNLDANSYRGSVVRKVLAELGVEAGTINHENLNQNIGYLVEWEGYEPVENPYSSEDYDVEYMLMGNMSDVQLDLLLEAMDENNIFVALKSIPTAWTASKTFSELFEIMAEESEVLQEAVALDKMIYTAEALDEATYGNSEYWDDLQKELAEALLALQTDAEESPEGAGLYRNARLELEQVYLLITGKQVLEGELELLLEELEDGSYKVTAQLNGEMEAPTFSYNWEPASSSEEAEAEHLIVKAEDLYKVSLDITGTDKCYGTMSATFNVSAKPEYTVSASKDSISVEVKEQEAAFNTPETKGYVVELYLGEELVQSQKVTEAKTVVFNNLLEETEYILKVNSYNVIGRSDIAESTVTTVEEEVVLPDDEGTNDDEDEPVEDSVVDNPEVENEEVDDKDTEDEAEGAVQTGDSSIAVVWMLILIASLGIGGYTVVRAKRRAE